MVLTLPEAVPDSVTVVTVVSQVMLKLAGMRMRMSLAAVIVATPASSVTVGLLAAVAGWPTEKVWLDAEDRVAVGVWIVFERLSVSAVAPPATRAPPARRLSLDETAVKLLNFRPEMVSVSPAAKFEVTFSTSVWLLSS